MKDDSKIVMLLLAGAVLIFMLGVSLGYEQGVDDARGFIRTRLK